MKGGGKAARHAMFAKAGQWQGARVGVGKRDRVEE